MDKKEAALIVSGLVAHISQLYIVGAKDDEALEEFSPSLASVIFMTGVAILAAGMSDKAVAPIQKCKPALSFVAEVFVMNLAMNLVLRLFWLPLTETIEDLNDAIVDQMCEYDVVKDGPLHFLADLLDCDYFQNGQELAAASTFLWTLANATGHAEALRQLIEQLRNRGQGQAGGPDAAECPPCEDEQGAGAGGDECEEEEEIEPRRAVRRKRC